MYNYLDFILLPLPMWILIVDGVVVFIGGVLSLGGGFILPIFIVFFTVICGSSLDDLIEKV